MTVYVEHLRDHGVAASRALVLRHTRWARLTADSRRELHKFARAIYLRRGWYQRPDGPEGAEWHYPVTEGRHARALANGAVLVAPHVIDALFESRRRDALGRQVAEPTGADRPAAPRVSVPCHRCGTHVDIPADTTLHPDLPLPGHGCYPATLDVRTAHDPGAVSVVIRPDPGAALAAMRAVAAAAKKPAPPADTGTGA